MLPVFVQINPVYDIILSAKGIASETSNLPRR